MPAIEIYARSFLVLVFIAAAFRKIRSREAVHGTAAWLATLPGSPVREPRVASAAAMALGLTEAVIALLAGLPYTDTTGLAAGGIALALFAALSCAAKISRREVTCHCFGPSDETIGMRHILRDVLLSLISFLGLSSLGPVAQNFTAIILCLVFGMTCAIVTILMDDIITFFAKERTGTSHDSGTNRDRRALSR
jgi:hypothetical protein